MLQKKKKKICALNRAKVIIVKFKDLWQGAYTLFEIHSKYTLCYRFTADSKKKIRKNSCEKTRGGSWQIVCDAGRVLRVSVNYRNSCEMSAGRKYLVIIVGGSTTGALYLHSRSSWSEMAAHTALWTGRSTFPFIGVDIKCNSSWRCFRLGGRPVLDLYLS